MAFEGEFKAPIRQQLLSGGCEVLDIGCGAGFWSMDMATKYPLSYFIGIDVDKNVFPHMTMQKNLMFQRVDIMSLPLPFEDNTFDYIFIRSMLNMIPEQQWEDIQKEIIRIMKKGGYIECVEHYADLFDTGPAMSKITRLINTTSSSRLNNYYHPDHPYHSSLLAPIYNPWPNRLALERYLIGIKIHHTHTPIGNHGGALGALMYQYWERIFNCFKQEWIQSKNISEKDLEVLLKEVLDEVEKNKTYMAWYSVVAQKKGYTGPMILIEDYDDQESTIP
ncbi:unnamed protein product [Cunninghamella echinulata]